MIAVKWCPVQGLEEVCADISLSWISERNPKLVVLMHFSRINPEIGDLENDLKIVFNNPRAFCWEEEPCSRIETPEILPRCSDGHCTHPLLIIKNSPWKDLHVMFEEDEEHLMHYFLISLNDLLHVLAASKPEVTWIPPSSLNCSLTTDS
jgi:hypothetical protein